jgi:hypothetical protein
MQKQITNDSLDRIQHFPLRLNPSADLKFSPLWCTNAFAPQPPAQQQTKGFFILRRGVHDGFNCASEVTRRKGVNPRSNEIWNPPVEQPSPDLNPQTIVDLLKKLNVELPKIARLR